jgi:hypothetical protein
MTHERRIDIKKVFEEGTPIDKALALGVKQALRVHKLLGNPVVEWRDGKAVWIPPEQIQIDDEPAD